MIGRICATTGVQSDDHEKHDVPPNEQSLGDDGSPTRHGRYDDPTGRLPLSHTIHEEEETHNDISRDGMGKTGAGGTHLVVLPSFLSSLLRLPQATATESPQDFPTYHNCVVLAQRQMESSSLRSRAEAAFRGLQLASSCMYNCALDSRAPKSVAPGPERPPLPKERTRVFAGAAGLFQKFYENTQLPTIDEREDVILAFARLPAKIEEGRYWMVFQKPTGLLLAKQSNTDLNFTAFLLAVLLDLSFVVSNRNAAQHAGRMMGHSSTHASPFSPKRRTCKRALI